MFTTLVLGAAMTNAITYVGAYRYLHERNMHASIKNVCGTSSGSMFGFMVALGLTPDQMQRVTTEYVRSIEVPRVTARRALDVWRLKGFLPDDFRRRFMISALRTRFPEMDDIDFATLTKLTGVNFVVVGLNLSRYQEETFSVDTHPTMSVLHAVDISTMLPLVFKPVTYLGDIFVDGGVTNVVPTDIVRDSEHTTLVMYIPWNDNGFCSTIPKNVIDILSLLFQTIMRIRMRGTTTRYKHTVKLAIPDDMQMNVMRMLNRKELLRATHPDTIAALDALAYKAIAAHMEEHMQPMPEPERVLPEPSKRRYAVNPLDRASQISAPDPASQNTCPPPCCHPATSTYLSRCMPSPEETP